MTKAELINALAAKIPGVNKTQIKFFLDAFKETAIEALKGEGAEFLFPDVVKIVVAKTSAKAERKGRNPKTGDTIIVKAKPAGVKVKARFPKSVKVAIGQLPAPVAKPKAPRAPRPQVAKAKPKTAPAAAPLV